MRLPGSELPELIRHQSSNRSTPNYSGTASGGQSRPQALPLTVLIAISASVFVTYGALAFYVLAFGK